MLENTAVLRGLTAQSAAQTPVLRAVTVAPRLHRAWGPDEVSGEDTEAGRLGLQDAVAFIVCAALGGLPVSFVKEAAR